tara:strand:- start:16568 stop:17443 length:876 start_codon:yes stop_codon:yes gene_type:complete
VIAFLFRPVLVGRPFGIPVRVMPAVVLLTLFLLASVAGAPPSPTEDYAPGATPETNGNFLLTLGLLAVLGFSLLAHELAHALVAQRVGYRVVDIVIWPFGGMARMEGIANRPRAEAKVALAGPLVNLIFAALLIPFPGKFFLYAGGINLILGLGNLIPAFPLDGGRVLRSFLCRHSPLSDATRAVTSFASWMAVGILLLAAMADSLFVGILFALYIWFVGRMELVQVILRTGQAPSLTPGQVFARFLRGIRGKEDEPAVESEAHPPDSDGATASELENFQGNLDEFFKHKR